MLLKDKTAIITGCNKGIGKVILDTFAQNGANIIACIRKESIDFNVYGNSAYAPQQAWFEMKIPY